MGTVQKSGIAEDTRAYTLPPFPSGTSRFQSTRPPNIEEHKGRNWRASLLFSSQNKHGQDAGRTGLLQGLCAMLCYAMRMVWYNSVMILFCPAFLRSDERVSTSGSRTSNADLQHIIFSALYAWHVSYYISSSSAPSHWPSSTFQRITSQGAAGSSQAQGSNIEGPESRQAETSQPGSVTVRLLYDFVRA